MKKSSNPPLAAIERQLSLSFDTRELRGMAGSSRRIILDRLTRVLLEAAGCAGQERADDEH